MHCWCNSLIYVYQFSISKRNRKCETTRIEPKVQTCNVTGGVETDPVTLFCVVPFVIVDELQIGDDINGVECVVLVVGGKVDATKPLDNVAKGFVCCDWACEF